MNTEKEEEEEDTEMELIGKRLMKKKSFSEMNLGDSFYEEDDENECLQKSYNLRSLMKKTEEIYPSIKKQNKESTFLKDMNTFRIPEEIFSSPLEKKYESFQEKDPFLISEFEKLVICPRMDWQEENFFRKIFEQTIIPVLTMGMNVSTYQRAILFEMIIKNRIVFQEIIPTEIAEKGYCDGCGHGHKNLTYIFLTYNDEGDQNGILKMGSHCGEKVYSVINLCTILNSLPFLPLSKKEWLMNAFTLIRYWCHRISILIATE